VTIQEVKNAIESLRGRHENPTIEKLRGEIGRGSLTTLLRFRNEVLEPEKAEPMADPEAMNAFRQIWQEALEIGRKSEADKVVEARAEVEALSREAERLENEWNLAEDQLAETRQALNRALEDATKARQEAQEARANLTSPMTFLTMVWEWLHSLPSLAKFALGKAIIVGIPPQSAARTAARTLSRRAPPFGRRRLVA
jgi:hypothetical protein